MYRHYSERFGSDYRFRISSKTNKLEVFVEQGNEWSDYHADVIIARECRIHNLNEKNLRTELRKSPLVQNTGRRFR